MKKAQFNFVWMFAIIVGGIILFLAVFGAMKAGGTSRYQSYSETGVSISIITDSLQAGFSEGSFGKISFQGETRINNICIFDEEFGKNLISVSTRSNIGNEWNSPGGEKTVPNKYIFSSEKSSGEDFYVFSKPFYFPYKVADLTFLISDNYCFIDAPDEISEEIIGLKIPNIEIENCTLPESIRVCFGSSGDGCDIKVNSTIVEKGSDEMDYVGNLMYAAIFSDKSTYDCNVERLKYRANKIAEEFSQKADLMNTRGCNTNMKMWLTSWSGELIADNTLSSLVGKSNDIEEKNEDELCRVWR